MNLKLIMKNSLSLINLTKAQIFFIYELAKIVIINKNKKLIFVVF